MAFNIGIAKTLLASTELPDAHAFGAEAAPGLGMPELDAAKDQSLVVGSDIVSFTTGVEADFRQAISDSSLFAQLLAAKQVGLDADPMRFFDAYFANLVMLGWMIQKRETAEFSYKGDAFDVHEAVIGVITAFLSPISGAAAAVLAVLKGLHEMNKDAPFITLFDKQSRRGKIGRFQFTFVHDDPDHGLMAEAMAFGLDADDRLTQVLFFKLHKGRTKLRRSTGSLSIDTEALKALKPQLAGKMMPYRQAFIAGVDLGPVGG